MPADPRGQGGDGRAPTDALTVAVAGLVRVRLSGLDHLRPSTRAWIAGGLAPLASDDADIAADVEVRITPDAPPPGRRIEHGLALHPTGVWVGDRLGNGGLIPFAEPGAPTLASPGVGSGVLGDRLYLFHLRAALWTHGASLLRAGVVEVAGRRIAIVGWSGAGKTRLLLELLTGHDGRLLGDDVVALLRDGRVAPVMTDLTVRSVHAEAVTVPGAPGARRLRHAVTGRLDVASREARSRTARRVASGLSEVARRSGEHTVGAAQLGIDPSPGAIGRLDRVVVLHPSGEADAVAFLAGVADTYLLTHDAVAAVGNATWPDHVPVDLLPPHRDRRALIATALDGVEVVTVRAPLDGATTAAVAARVAG